LAASRYYYGGGYGNGGGLGGNDGGTPIGFLGGRGAVGYQPVIRQYMEGASMTVTAVVSADRRYVRCSFPSYGLTFSGIGEVNTFNTVSGESGDSSGGTGGSGFGGSSGGFGGGGSSGGFQ
jgi:hypothetical protein